MGLFSQSTKGSKSQSSHQSKSPSSDMSYTQQALDANLAQGQADRHASSQMALDAKRTALQDAMNRTVINGGNSFKNAAGR